MSRYRIAVIGGGVSGMVASHYLAKAHQVVLFEAQDRLGGHVNTVRIPEGERFGRDAGTPVDTGFIVFNDRTYPTLIRFLAELGLQGSPTDMSFSYFDAQTGFTYAGTGFSGLFARRQHLFSPGYWTFLWSISQFFRRASMDLKTRKLEGITLGQYVQTLDVSPQLLRHYLSPMTQAIWSAPEGATLTAPADYFLRFFDNHGLLAPPGKLQWLYLKGGSDTYVRAFRDRFPGEIRLSAPVHSVERPFGAGPLVHFSGGAERFDAVVLAAHADQALNMLFDADEFERETLAPWTYSRNRTVLHADAAHMPPNRRSWASWNVVRNGEDDLDRPARVTYWMDKLQRLDVSRPWFVSLNAEKSFAQGLAVFETVYEHPVYTLVSLEAQKKLPALSGRRGTFFCGSYHGHGFHEDGARSGLEVARRFGIVP
jgi:uncharacterized protein